MTYIVKNEIQIVQVKCWRSYVRGYREVRTFAAKSKNNYSADAASLWSLPLSLSLSLPDTGRSSGISAPHVLQHSCLRCKLTRDRQTDRQAVSRNDKNRNRTKCLAPIWMKSQVFYRCKAYWSMEPHQYISIQWFRLKLICVLITQFCFSIDLLLTYLPTCDAYCPFLLPVFLDVPQPFLSQDRLTAVKLPQEHIAKIEKWLQDKQIKANPNKCNHITFALRKQSLTVFCNSQIYLSHDKKETWQLFRKPMCSRCQWSLDM